jgi:serpin B
MRIATNNVVASFATGRAAVIVTRGTAEQPFFLDAARTVTVPLMRGSANLTYTENDQLQAVALPFRAPGMSMIVILPKKVDGLAEVEASLSVANLDEWIRGSPPGGRSSRAVEVFLPKFTMTTEINLSGVLGAMGMPNAFRESADFSGISPVAGVDRLRISSVLHKAYLDVDEEGAEAAAATAVAMMGGSRGAAPVPVVFRPITRFWCCCGTTRPAPSCFSAA